MLADDWPGIMDLQDEIMANPTLLTPAFDSLMGKLSQNGRHGNAIMRILTVISSLQSNGIPRIEEKIASRPYLDLLAGTLSQANKNSEFFIVRIIQDHLESLLREDRGRSDYLIARVEEMRRSGLLLRGVVSGQQVPPPPKPDSMRQQSQSQAAQQQKQQEQKEKEDMELAIALSLSEAESKRSNNVVSSTVSTTTTAAINNNVSASTLPSTNGLSSGSKFKFVMGLYDFSGDEQGELSFTKNQIISVIDSSHPDWWKGELNGRVGIFPSNYVKTMEPNVPTSVKLSSSLASSTGGINSSQLSEQINRLHSLLLAQSKNPSGGAPLVENHELQELYHKVLVTRPKLARELADSKKKLARNGQVSGKLDAALKKYENWEKTMLSQPSPYHQETFSSAQYTAVQYNNPAVQYNGPQFSNPNNNQQLNNPINNQQYNNLTNNGNPNNNQQYNNLINNGNPTNNQQYMNPTNGPQYPQ